MKRFFLSIFLILCSTSIFANSSSPSQDVGSCTFKVISEDAGIFESPIKVFMKETTRENCYEGAARIAVINKAEKVVTKFEISKSSSED
ncbi:MAG: hypothetical protein ACXVLQ_12415 [Bacteriovorax sp.]